MGTLASGGLRRIKGGDHGQQKHTETHQPSAQGLGREWPAVFVRILKPMAFPLCPASQLSSSSVQMNMWPLLRMRTLGSKIPMSEKTEEFDEGCSAIMTTCQAKCALCTEWPHHFLNDPAMQMIFDVPIAELKRQTV